MYIKNILKSLAYHHQRQMCYLLMANDANQLTSNDTVEQTHRPLTMPWVIVVYPTMQLHTSTPYIVTGTDGRPPLTTGHLSEHL